MLRALTKMLQRTLARRLRDRVDLLFVSGHLQLNLHVNLAHKAVPGHACRSDKDFVVVRNCGCGKKTNNMCERTCPVSCDALVNVRTVSIGRRRV